MKNPIWLDCEGNSRRDFIRIGGAGLMGLGLADLLRLEARASVEESVPAKTKSVILVWLAGGPATIDMWDMKPEASANIRGEFKPITTTERGIQISEHMPRLARVMHHCSIVRSLHHSIPSHGPGTTFMHTGHKPSPVIEYPSLGSLTSRLMDSPAGVPAYVTLGRIRDRAASAGYLGSSFNPFEVEGNAGKGQLRVRGLSLPNGFGLDQLANREKLLNVFDARFEKLEREGNIVASLDKFQEQAFEILRGQATRKAFDLSQEPKKQREYYGMDNFGQGALVARRLVEAGVRFVSLSMGGWDTHSNNFNSLKDTRLPNLDRALSALILDLNNRGLLGSTVVYCAGEFGRTPKVNDRGGRDHWSRSMSVLLAGGGFKRGFVYGSTDGEGMRPKDNPCLPADLSATLFYSMGIDPQHELTTPTGRPMKLFQDGEVLHDLLS
ncbi:MAG: hypothetical protein CMO80_14260 [Verrucomicrobiales bacterium]|nr:hypothetical protein [Verrucomicrobiales bacterium]